MNPLDLPEELFVALHIAMVIFAYWLANAVTRQIGDSHPPARPLTVPELAYLAGEESHARVRDTVLVGLLTRKAATLSPDGGAIHIDGSKIGDWPDLAPFTKIGLDGDMKWNDSLNRFPPAITIIEDELETLGLRPNLEQRTRCRLLTLPLFAIPLILGVAKLPGVNSSGVGVLLFFSLMVTVLMGSIYLMAPVPLLTRAGEEELAAQKLRHERAARAPLENELMLAVALTGLAALYGTPYEILYKAAQEAASGCGCGGD